MRKVLSWLRSKPQRDGDAAALADAWRLDTAGAPHSLEPPPLVEPHGTPELRTASGRRTVQELRPAADPRPLRTSRPASEPPAQEPRPAPEPRNVRGRRPSGAPQPSAESRIVQELRTIQALREVQELRLAPAARREESSQPAAAPRSAPQPAPHEGTLLAVGLVKSFGGRRVVNDVSIGLRRGEAVTAAFWPFGSMTRADPGHVSRLGIMPERPLPLRFVAMVIKCLSSERPTIQRGEYIEPPRINCPGL